jgi:hypothetical protein
MTDDILVNKTYLIVNAFYNEFRHLQTLPTLSIFYIKRNNNIIPFRGFGWHCTQSALSSVYRMDIKVLFQGNQTANVPVRDDDELYFTTDMLNLTDYIQPISAFMTDLSSYMTFLDTQEQVVSAYQPPLSSLSGTDMDSITSTPPDSITPVLTPVVTPPATPTP